MPDAVRRELRVPPVLLAGAALAAQVALAPRASSRSCASAPRTASLLVGSALLAASAGLAGDTVLRFRRARTTVDPTAPARASTLVVAGANRLTRNPMYVAMAGVLLGHAVARRSWTAVLPAAAFVAAMAPQIAAEERGLAERFGPGYERYREQVPRWLGPGTLRALRA